MEFVHETWCVSMILLDIFMGVVNLWILIESRFTCHKELTSFRMMSKNNYGTCDDDRAIAFVGDAARKSRRARGKFVHARLGVVQFQAMTVTAEGVGEDDVRAGPDELAMQLDDSLRMICDPELGWLTRFETDLEIIRARRPVGEEWTAEREEVLQARSHDANASPSRFRQSRLPNEVAKMPQG